MPTSFKTIIIRNTEISYLYYVLGAGVSNFGIYLKDYGFDLDSFQAARLGSRNLLGQKYMDNLFQGVKDYRNRSDTIKSRNGNYEKEPSWGLGT